MIKSIVSHRGVEVSGAPSELDRMYCSGCTSPGPWDHLPAQDRPPAPGTLLPTVFNTFFLLLLLTHGFVDPHHILVPRGRRIREGPRPSADSRNPSECGSNIKIRLIRLLNPELPARDHGNSRFEWENQKCDPRSPLG